MLPSKNQISFLAVVLVAAGVCLFSPIIALGSLFSHGSQDFRNQCDSAVGPDPSATVTTEPTRADRPQQTVSAVPSTNPYSAMTVDADDRNVPDRYRACMAALRSAPYQVPGSIGTTNSGSAVSCAQRLALDYAERGTGDPAALARDVIFAASAVEFSGQCTPTAAPAGSDSVPSGCGDPSGPRRAILLPETVSAQSHCGQRVVTDAVTAGDLIFWDYRNHAATQVGVAVSGTEMVAGAAGAGSFVRVAIPDSEDIRIKRVLGGEL